MLEPKLKQAVLNWLSEDFSVRFINDISDMYVCKETDEYIDVNVTSLDTDGKLINIIVHLEKKF